MESIFKTAPDPTYISRNNKIRNTAYISRILINNESMFSMMGSIMNLCKCDGFNNESMFSMMGSIMNLCSV